MSKSQLMQLLGAKNGLLVFTRVKNVSAMLSEHSLQVSSLMLQQQQFNTKQYPLPQQDKQRISSSQQQQQQQQQ
eukprot:UN09667